MCTLPGVDVMIEVPEELMVELGRYLGSRPYAEVAVLISALSQCQPSPKAGAAPPDGAQQKSKKRP